MVNLRYCYEIPRTGKMGRYYDNLCRRCYSLLDGEREAVVRRIFYFNLHVLKEACRRDNARTTRDLHPSFERKREKQKQVVEYMTISNLQSGQRCLVEQTNIILLTITMYNRCLSYCINETTFKKRRHNLKTHLSKTI